MTNEEIQKHIEQNCRHEDGSPAMDEQGFYEGAKWMRDKALSLHNTATIMKTKETNETEKMTIQDIRHWTKELLEKGCPVDIILEKAGNDIGIVRDYLQHIGYRM